MRLDFIMTGFSAGSMLIIGATSTTLNESNPGIQNLSQTTTMNGPESLSKILHINKECSAGTYACGSLCCPSPGTCSVDITAKCHCCQDNTFCAANTTNAPVSTGNRVSSIPLLYWFIMIFSVVMATKSMHDMFDHSTISEKASNPLPTAHSLATISSSMNVGQKWHTTGKFDQHADCAGVLWKALQKCCIEDTIPHYYTTGEYGCCPRAFDGQPDAQIEAQCPAAVGDANLKPLGWGVPRSQASRSPPEWAKYVSSKLLTAGMWKSVRADIKSDVTASPTNKEVTATKRQIFGRGCGGFDTNCQQTCPPGWATCETSIAEAVSSHGWTFLVGAAMVFGSFVAFLL